MNALSPEAIAYAQRLHEKGYSIPELARLMGIQVSELRKLIVEVR